MKVDANECEFTWTKGQGPGGQNKNKLETACKVRHVPTGVIACADERTRSQSRKEALKSLGEKLDRLKQLQEKEKRKAKRDAAIKDNTRVRTYDYSRDTVTDHRTGKTASIKDILGKGRLDKLR